MLRNPFLRRTEIFYRFFIRIGSNLQTLFLLYMRLTWSYPIVEEGFYKLRLLLAENPHYTALRTGHPFLTSPLVEWSLVLCSFCLAIGFASRLAALPIVAITLALLVATPEGTIEAPLSSLLNPHFLVKKLPYFLFVTAALVFCFGPGRISVDAWLKRWAERKPKY
ncbi:MAG: DoxX family protein [Verrucomicrobiota bacterium]|nr:DoxX family protein [Verrucomicrobiota bacterium]